MSSPENNDRPRAPKRHPPCPGRGRCTIPSCIHNAPNNRFLTDEIPLGLYEVNRLLGAYPAVRFAQGWLYERLDAASGRTNVRERNDEARASIGTMMHVAEVKIREVSGTILDRVRFYLSAEMQV